MSRQNQHAQAITDLVGTIADELANETDLLAVMTEAAAAIEALRSGMSIIADKRRMAVRGLHASGMSYARIGDQVGISRAGVFSIDKGKT